MDQSLPLTRHPRPEMGRLASSCLSLLMAVVVAFGLATLAGNGHERPGESAGASPGSGSWTPAADVYGLGAILEFLLAAPGLDGRVNRRLQAIVARAKAASPNERYQNVPALMADVSAFLDGAPIAAYRERIWERALRVARRHQVALVLLLAYLLARAFVFLVYRR